MKSPASPIRLTPSDWLIEILTSGLLIACLIYASLNYYALPEKIPTHFGLSGQPDGFGNKSNLLFLMGASLFTYFLVLLCNKYPALINYPFDFTPQNEMLHFKNAFSMIRILKLVVVIIFCEIIYSTIRTAQGHQYGLHKFMIPLLLMLLIGVLAIFMVRGYLISKR